MRRQSSKGLAIPDRIRKRLEDKKWLRREFAKGKSAQEILDVSDGEIDTFYEAACCFFEKERYEDAAKTYLFLATLNPRVHEFWLGLAMSAQMCGDFEGALAAYEIVSWDLVDLPLPYFYLGNCFIAVGDFTNALIAFDLAVEMCGTGKEFEDLRYTIEKERVKLLQKK